MALSLAHQSRIRHLYPQIDGKNESIRPDSSSSASSATDWDSGHATVLRRQTQNQVNIYKIANKKTTPIQINVSSLSPLVTTGRNTSCSSKEQTQLFGQVVRCQFLHYSTYSYLQK